MKLPIIFGVEVVKMLSKFGFSVTRQSGSHIILIKEVLESKGTVVVLKHRELAKGALLSILSQSGLSKEEFLKKL